MIILSSAVLDLLSTFTVPQIMMFIVLIAVAFKKIADFLDWFSEKINKKTKKQQSELDESKEYKQRLQDLEENVIHITENVDQIAAKINILMESDKDNIKAFITREHHYFCYQKGWIDDYSLDCIEKLYSHYVEEKGNSFILDFMQEIRCLPKQPLEKDKGAM